MDNSSNIAMNVGAVVGGGIAFIIAISLGMGRIELIVLVIILGAIGAWIGSMIAGSNNSTNE